MFVLQGLEGDGPELFGQGLGAIAVKIFFVISGFLITKSYINDSNAFRYLVRRFFRIFPALILVCFLVAFVLGPIVSEDDTATYFGSLEPLKYFIMNSCLLPIHSLPGVFIDNPYPGAVNGSLWTLPVEFSMYLLLSLVVIVFGRLRVLKSGIIVVTLVLFALDLWWLMPEQGGALMVFGRNVGAALSLIPFFFAGACFMFFEPSKRIYNLQLAALLFSVAAFLKLESAVLREVVVFAVLPYATLAFSLAQPTRFGRLFAVHDYSYGIYIWAFPLQQAMVHYLGPTILPLNGYSLPCFLVTLVFAIISWHLVEHPSIRLSKHITKWSQERGTMHHLSK